DERFRVPDVAEGADGPATGSNMSEQRVIAAVRVVHQEPAGRDSFSRATLASGNDWNGRPVKIRIDRRRRKSRRSSASAVGSPAGVRAARSESTDARAAAA